MEDEALRETVQQHAKDISQLKDNSQEQGKQLMVLMTTQEGHAEDIKALQDILPRLATQASIDRLEKKLDDHSTLSMTAILEGIRARSQQQIGEEANQIAREGNDSHKTLVWVSVIAVLMSFLSIAAAVFLHA